MTFSLPPELIISLLVSVVIPGVVGLVTTRVTDSGVKGILLAVLSVLTGVITEGGAAIVSGEPYDVGAGILNAVLALAVAQGSYSSIWKPTGAAESLKDIGVTANPDLAEPDANETFEEVPSDDTSAY